jgi:hypothetical protein
MLAGGFGHPGWDELRQSQHTSGGSADLQEVTTRYGIRHGLLQNTWN